MKRQDGVQEEMKKVKNQQEGKAEVTQDQKDYKGELKETRNEIRKKETKLKPIAEVTRMRSKTAEINRIYKLYSLILTIIRSERQYRQNNKLKNRKYTNPPGYQKIYPWGKKRALKKKGIEPTGQFYIDPTKPYSFPRQYPFYKDDSDVSDISSSEEDERYMGESSPHKLLWHQKGKCYWKQKVKKFSHKLFKALIENNERLEDLNKDWENINEVVDEMREEMENENENEKEDAYYEQLQNERLKLTTDLKKLKKELRILKEQ